MLKQNNKSELGLAGAVYTQKGDNISVPTNQFTSQALQSDRPLADSELEREDLSVFFTIGITINIIMLIVFVIWAIKQWKMRNALRK